MIKSINSWKALIILSSIGIILALYLFYNFLTKPLLESCYVNSVVNCDAVTKGQLSTLFGVPVSLIGLIGYVVIFVASVFKKLKTTLGMATFGMVFCLYLTIQEVFFLHVLCPVCLACQLVMLLVFLIALNLKLSYQKRKK